MPVPKNYQSKYSTIVAAQTARLKQQGKSGGEANDEAKRMADAAIEHLKKKSHAK